MKLRYGRTALVGLAFFSICAFWNLYDTVVPLILRDAFNYGDGVSGVIMALDNVLALALLPFFGALSDKTDSRIGKRMPYILVGTLVAAILMIALPFAVNGRSMPFFFVCLALLLLAMCLYRSPAVALMPDVTPKPLRSIGNAVINLLGTLGGLFTLIFIKVFVAPGINPDYTAVFVAVAALMVVSVGVLFFTVNEKRLTAEVPKDEEPAKKDSGGSALPAPVKKSLGLILASVSLWFMGYNAVTTAFTKYATSMWGQDIGGAANCLMIAIAGAVVSYLPIGWMSAKWGRKRTILIGIASLTACFLVGAVVASKFTPWLYFMFAVVGFAWAAINVNSYPMVVEISKSGNVGKYTGYYYTFSMAAQILTPILSGFLLEYVGYWTLFPYAALMVALSFVTMSMTRHGDSRPTPPASKLEAFDVAD